MWVVTDNQNNQTTIKALKGQYPNSAGFDECGMCVAPDRLDNETADNGYGDDGYRKITFWPDVSSSEAGYDSLAVAVAELVEE